MLDEPCLDWLLSCPEPAVRRLTCIDLLNCNENDPRVVDASALLLEGEWIKALFADQESDGGFGVHPYQKWMGAHWRLISLVELGIPAGEPRALAAAEQVLGWLGSPEHRNRIQVIDGRTRRCASQEGNALAVCSRLGLADDPRVQRLAESLIAWQWHDGGWNCDRRPEASHSSFYESLAPMWGLIEYHRATGNVPALAAARQTAELMLAHHLFRSHRSGEVINQSWLKLHYPLYWHVDFLQQLLVLSRLGPLSDPRLDDALDLLEKRRLGNGCWRAGEYYWKRIGGKQLYSEAVDWGRGGPSYMITLNALRVLNAAGRLSFS